MAASERLALLLQAQTTGQQEVAALQKSIDQLLKTAEGTKQKVQDTASGAKWNQFADDVKNFVQNPLQSAGNALEGFLKGMGPAGTVAAAGAASFGILAKQGFDAAKSLGEYGDRIEDISVKTGMSAKEVAQFSFAMKRAGGDISSVEGIMRQLSRGLADTGDEGKVAREGLAKLGIQARDSDGQLRPMSGIILELSAALSKIPDVANRNKVALDVMGRGALDALPDILELSEGVKRAKELGLGPSDADLKRWKEYQQQVVEVDAAWERLKRKLKEPLAATVIFAIKWTQEKPPAGSIAAAVQEGIESKGRGGYTKDLMLGEFSPGLLGNGLPGPKPEDVGTFAAGVTADIASRERGNALAKTAKARMDTTVFGLEKSLSEAKKAAEEARSAVSDLNWTTEDGAKKAISAWDAAEAKVRRYEEALKSARKAQELAILTVDSSKFGMPTGAGEARYSGGPLIGGLNRTPTLSRGGATLQFDQYGNRYYKSPGDLQINSKDLIGGAGESEAQKSLSQGIVAVEERRAQREKQQRDDALSHEARMIELRSGPNGEYAAVEKVYNLRMLMARTEEEAQRAEYDREERIAELRKEQLANYRQGLGQVYDAMLAGREGIKGLILGQAQGVGRTIFQNAGMELFKGGKLSLPGQGTADNPNILGRLLMGTPFGIDPLKTATDANTMATVANTAALRSISLSPSGGGGGVLSGVMRGTGGMVFSGFGGQRTLSSEETDQIISDMNAGKYDETGGSGGGGKWMKGAGYAAAAGAAAYTAYGGFKAGGAQGNLQGTSAVLGGAALIPGPQQPFIAGAAMAVGLVAALMGDPKQKRQEKLNAEMERRRYTEPVGTSYGQDIYGRSLDYDYRGGTRVFQTVVYNTNNIDAMDASTFRDYLKQNPAELAEGVSHAITSGNAEDVLGLVRQSA